jgi:hypothetical protein
MTDRDPVLQRLASLPARGPDAELSARVRAMAHARLRPRQVGSVWAFLIAVAAVGYLGWAMNFVGHLPRIPEGPSADWHP